MKFFLVMIVLFTGGYKGGVTTISMEMPANEVCESIVRKIERDVGKFNEESYKGEMEIISANCVTYYPSNP